MTDVIIKIQDESPIIIFESPTVFNIKTEESLTKILSIAEQGPTGPVNLLDIGTVETLETGVPATATITGVYPDQELNLGLPKGNTGDKGDTGAGVATGGSVGQYLRKKSLTDHDTEFSTILKSEVSGLASDLTEMKSRISNALTTTVLSGCVITWTNGGTTVDISSGTILFSTAYPDAVTPHYDIVSYAGVTGLAPEYLETEIGSFFYITRDGVLVQYPEQQSTSEMAVECLLGWVAHYDYATIAYGLNEKYDMRNNGQQLASFFEHFGAFNADGNIFSANADLTLQRSAGEIFDGGTGVQDNNKRPNEYYSDLIPVISINYTHRDALGEWQYPNPVTEIDAENYDPDGLGLTPVPTGKFTIQYLYMYLDLSHDIIYGQDFYESLAEAESNLDTAIVINPDVSYNILRAKIIVQQGCTDLSDPLCAKIVSVDRFSTALSSSGGASGEVNTAENVNLEGIGVYDSKSGVNLRFRGIVSDDPRIVFTYDAINKVIRTKYQEAFEDIANNARSNNAVYAYDVNGNLSTKTWTTAGGNIVLTYAYDVNGNLETKTLSGAGLPSGTATVKTYNYDVNGNLETPTYT